MARYRDPHLPLSSLRLLVPPLRLMSACMWQVAQERDVDQYDKLAEFITLVTEMGPELMSCKQKTQLILGLRARVSSVFDLSSFDFQFEQFISDHDDLRKILQHQKQRQKLTKSEFSLVSDTILSTLAIKQMSVAPEDHIDSGRDGKGGDGSGEATDDSSIEPDPSNLQLQEGGLSPLTSSPCSEEAGVAGDHASSLVPLYCSLKSVSETQVSLSEERCKCFRKPVILRRHLRAEHPTLEQLHHCDRCEKTFQAKRRLEQHLQAHANLKPYVCSYCGKGQPYLCTECGRAFSHKGSFRIHSRLHAGERPYHCKDCGKKHITLNRLKVHQQTHTGERPFACPQCGKCFRYQSGLAVHNRIHTRERPYKCVACDKRFYSAHNLKIHLRSHKNK